MLCLSGLEQYSCWVPLLYYKLGHEKFRGFAISTVLDPLFLKLPPECSFLAFRALSDYSFLFCEDRLSFVNYTFRQLNVITTAKKLKSWFGRSKDTETSER